jgi:hypothetical protein
MQLDVGYIVFDTPTPQALAPFWEQLLGWKQVESKPDRYVELAHPDAADGGGGPRYPRLLFFHSPDRKAVKNRVHLDLRPDDQQAQVERALRLGARRVDIGQAADDPWVVLADPEGNEFCIVPAAQ